MEIRDCVKIVSKGRDISYQGDGKANHYFLLMVYGVKQKQAFDTIYKK